jgi:hypothetical protein
MAENKGIQNLLAAEEAAASLVQAAREGPHTDHFPANASTYDANTTETNTM